MTKLVEMEIGDGRTLLVEANDDVSVPRGAAPTYRGATRDSDVRARFEAVGDTLTGLTEQAVQSLRAVDAEIERVTLQFGISLGGEAGVPFVTKDASDGTLSVTIECNLSARNKRLSLDGD